MRIRIRFCLAVAVACSFVCHPVRDLLLSLLLPSPPSHNKKNVISTEAAHRPNVSSAVEKSASLPIPSSNYNRPATHTFHHPNGATSYHLQVTHSQNIASKLSAV
jgi:hypothetical protein